MSFGEALPTGPFGWKRFLLDSFQDNLTGFYLPTPNRRSNYRADRNRRIVVKIDNERFGDFNCEWINIDNPKMKKFKEI